MRNTIFTKFGFQKPVVLTNKDRYSLLPAKFTPVVSANLFAKYPKSSFNSYLFKFLRYFLASQSKPFLETKKNKSSKVFYYKNRVKSFPEDLCLDELVDKLQFVAQLSNAYFVCLGSFSKYYLSVIFCNFLKI